MPEDPDDPIVLPDLVFDDTDTRRAARAALTELAEQERRLPGGKPTPEQLVSAAERIASDDF